MILKKICGVFVGKRIDLLDEISIHFRKFKYELVNKFMIFKKYRFKLLIEKMSLKLTQKFRMFVQIDKREQL